MAGKSEIMIEMIFEYTGMGGVAVMNIAFVIMLVGKKYSHCTYL